MGTPFEEEEREGGRGFFPCHLHRIYVPEAALIGPDGATIPCKVIEQLLKHPLADIGIERFLADWKKVPKK